MRWYSRQRPFMRYLLIGGVALVLVISLTVGTAPFWLRPVIESRASATFGREVTIGRLVMSSTRPIRVTANQVVIASTPQVPEVPYFAKIERLFLTLDLAPLLHGGMFTIPDVTIEGMDIAAVENSSGNNNYSFVLPADNTVSHWASPSVGGITIADSRAHVVLSGLGLDSDITIKTEGEIERKIVGDVTGKYRGQPVIGRLVGGAVLSLWDVTTRYPIDIHLVSGDSSLSMVGTVGGLFQLHDADVKLELVGPDMALLYPLTGVPFPHTPPFRLTSRTDYQDKVIRFRDITGRLGSSDLNGQLTADVRSDRPVLSGEVRSRQIDLEDLGGFIGSQPGRPGTPDQTPEQQRAVANAIANPRLIPNLQMDLPKIRSADFHIMYLGDKIVGRAPPFDSISTRIDIENAHIKITDFRLGVGTGQILGQIDMTPVNDNMHTVADFKFQRLDVARLLAGSGFIHGAGVLGGEAKVDANGKSFAEILDNGNGHLSLFMAGGNVSALIIDLSGIQLGDAALSALGLPNRTQILCLAADLALVKGVLRTRTLLLDTTDDRTTVQGSVDMRTETVAAQLRTQAKHLSIGVLPTPIAISGTLKNPHFVPEAGELVTRGAAAVGLGLLIPPAALLPTIRLGIGEDNACAALARENESRQPGR